MGKIVKEQVNFNTVLLILITALVSLAVAKADKAFTEITRLQVQEEEMDRRVSILETAMGIIVIPKKPHDSKPAQ